MGCWGCSCCCCCASAVPLQLLPDQGCGLGACGSRYAYIQACGTGCVHGLIAGFVHRQATAPQHVLLYFSVTGIFSNAPHLLMAQLFTTSWLAAAAAVGTDLLQTQWPAWTLSSCLLQLWGSQLPAQTDQPAHMHTSGMCTHHCSILMCCILGWTAMSRHVMLSCTCPGRSLELVQVQPQATEQHAVVKLEVL